MDRKADHQAVVVKTEDPIRASPFLDYFPAAAGGLPDYYFHSNSSSSISELVDEKGTLGFMELLGMQDLRSCVLDNSTTGSTVLVQVPPPPPPPPPPVSSSPDQEPGGPQTRRNSQLGLEIKAALPLLVVVPEESVDVFINNGPPSPNSSSMSLEESNGAQRNTGDHRELISGSAVDDHPECDPEEHEQEQQPNETNNKHLKAKKTSAKKRQKEPRFAFMTKSEVDHLEDGYRWRKYGQKAVKNSPFPRSYYRCTSGSCNVKKRVERSFNDPSIVVTTYEGQHIHPSPIMHHRPPPAVPSPAAAVFTVFPQGPNCFSPNTFASFGLPMPTEVALSQQPQYLNSNNNSLHCGFTTTSTNSTVSLLERRLLATPIPSAALLRDDGLLQDVVHPP